VSPPPAAADGDGVMTAPEPPAVPGLAFLEQGADLASQVLGSHGGARCCLAESREGGRSVSIQLIRATLASTLLASTVAAAPRTFDECLRNLRSGPTSFVDYLCLGTPGLPDRAPEVRAVLRQLLERSPGEPHARLYLALMRVYKYEDVDKSEFTEPLETFERQEAWVDAFLARLALMERVCFRDYYECRRSGSLLASAEQLAQRIGDRSLMRLSRIARMRWSTQVLGTSEARRSEKSLDALGGDPPDWLRVLEVNTRALVAGRLGDDFRARQLYAQLASATPIGSVAHGAALSGMGAATARLAWQGLANRADAERLLRTALSEQQRLGLIGYNSIEIGAAATSDLLALLVGRNPDTLALIDQDDPSPLTMEFLLQGSMDDQRRALQMARARVSQELKVPRGFWMLARAHAEFWAGSDAEAMQSGSRAIAIFETLRAREGDEEIRMKDDWVWTMGYQTLVSDLLATRRSDLQHLELALQVSEQLRARVLLQSLLERELALETEHNPIPGIAELQSALRGDEALVSFVVWAPRPNLYFPYTRGQSWALVLTKHALRAVPIARGEVLEPAVKAWARLVDERSEETEPGGRRLYADTLGAVIDVLPAEVRSLILVPDGPLHRLPFDALSETGGPPYVAERYSISIVPSAAVWFRLRQRPAPPPGVSLAFANTPDGPAVRIAETRGEVDRGQLPVLLHAREEAREAVDAFGRGSRLLAGEGATPDRLSPSELGRASLVHFAAHGVVNDRQPEESFLLLAPGAGGSGKLKVADVPKFDWSGKTVVLSACDTSVGAVRIGEGVLSLARGFFAGGASAVVGTLSQVRDEEQRALFHAFYGELRRGVSVGEAMATAKRALIRRGMPPAAWANVVVLGDATVRPRAPETPSRDWVLLLAAALGAALLVALGLRTRRRRQEPEREALG
jgi:CHAT domain-containing protein